MAQASRGSSTLRPASATVPSTTLCADEKPSWPQGCGTLAAGYVPASKDASFTPIPVPSPPAGASIPAGTISTEIGTGPFSSEEYLTHDGWWNKMNGRAYDVYSGSLYSDPAQGVVVVLSGPADDPTQSGASTLKAFPSPGRDGSLTMTASSGWTITLRATDGATYSFDVATEQYVAG